MGDARSRHSVAWLLPMLALVACGPAGDSGPDSAPFSTLDADRVIAKTSDYSITVGDVERYVGRHVDSLTGSPSATPRERYANLARRMVVERLLLAEAEALGLDQNVELGDSSRQQRRLLYSQEFLRQRGQPDPITEAQLREHFDEAKGRLDQPESRRVSHIFLRYTENDDRDSVRQRLGEIRRLVEEGQSFGLLAREHSQSESRHRDGLLGFVERGIFPSDFDDIVFALEPEVPSEVVSTRDGAHLFFVHNILPAIDVDFEDVRELLLRELALEQLLERLRSVAESLPPLEQTWMVEPEQLNTLLGEAAPKRALVRVGDVEITVAELREQLRPWNRHLAEISSGELPRQLLDEMRWREVIFQHVSEQDPESLDLGFQEEQVALARRQALLEKVALEKMTSQIEGDPKLLEEYREQNSLRFSTPLLMRIERLWVDPGTSGPSVMSQLEESRTGLDSGEISLKDLASQLDGELESMPYQALPALRSSDPTAVRFAPLLRNGEHSPPYLLRGRLTMFKLVERQDPQPLPLDEVRDRVVADYLEHHSSVLFEDITKKLLADAGFELTLPP